MHDGALVDESMLAAEYVFLKKLKDLRFDTAKGQRGFTPKELTGIFEDRAGQARERAAKAVAAGKSEGDACRAALLALKFTEKQLADLLEKRVQGRPLPEQGVVEPPSGGGRSPYCRPALRILKALILSGLAPAEFKNHLIAREAGPMATLAEEIRLGTDMGAGLVEDDLTFLDRMGASWDRLYIPDARLDDAAKAAERSDAAGRERMVRRLIGEQNDPVVRHRLGAFHRKLRDLEARFGPPDRVVIEFVREDFLAKGKSKQARDRYQKFRNFQKRRREERSKALAALGGGASGSDVLKYQLWDDQKGHCLFCGNTIAGPNVMPEAGGRSFATAELAHIVPDSLGGPRTYLNLVVACHDCNHAQKERYHADWFRQDGRDWDALLNRIRTYTRIPRFKLKLLSCEDSEQAADMVENRTSLQQTAWIAKLSQAVACLHFGWPLNFKGADRRVVVVPGALTNAVARRYHLYRLLGSEESRAAAEARLKELREAAERVDRNSLPWDERNQAWQAYHTAVEETEKKARDDHRHHALDAMVLSFIPAWAADPNKRYWHSLPGPADWDFFAERLRTVVPTWVATEKPRLEDGIYGDRGGKAAKRLSLKSLGYSGRTPKFSLSALRKAAANIWDRPIRDAVQAFVAGEPPEEAWVAFCDTFRAPRPDGSVGPRVLSVLIATSELDEFADLSKDGTGAWRRGKRHKGYFVALDPKGKPKVFPVYAHASEAEVRRSIRAREGWRDYGYFESGCRVRIAERLVQGKHEVGAGVYILSSLWTNGQSAIMGSDGTVWRGIGIGKLVSCGLARVH